MHDSFHIDPERHAATRNSSGHFKHTICLFYIMDYRLFELISHLGNILGIYMLDMINHIGLVQCQGRFSVNNNPFLPFPPHKSIKWK